MEFTYDIIVYFSIFCFLGILSLFKWRSGFFIFLIYIFFEDAIRMIFFKNNVAVQIGKDLLLIGVYVGCYMENRILFKNYKFIPMFLIVICYQAANILNPRAASLLSGAASLKLSFFYLPLIWIASIYFNKPKYLGTFLLTCSMIMGIISVIALIQVINGPEAWWNFFGNYEPLKHFSYHSWVQEDVFRPFSIFNNSGRFMHLLFIYYFYFLLAWTLQDVIFTKAQKNFFLITCIFFLSGFIYSINRTTFLVLIFMTVIYIIQVRNLSTKELFRQVVSKRLGLIFLILIIFVATSTLWPTRVQRIIEFLYQSVTPGQQQYSVPERIGGALDNFKLALSESGLIGHGTGTNSLGMVYLLGVGYQSYVESGYATVLWEEGIIGLACFIVAWIMLIKFFFFLRSRSKSFYLTNISYLMNLCIISFLASFTGGFQLFQSWIFNLLFWNLIGIVLAIYINDNAYFATKQETNKTNLS